MTYPNLVTNYGHDIHPIRRQLGVALLQLWQLDAGQPQPRPGPALHNLRRPGMRPEEWASVLCTLAILALGLFLMASWWLA